MRKLIILLRIGNLLGDTLVYKGNDQKNHGVIRNVEVESGFYGITNGGRLLAAD